MQAQIQVQKAGLSELQKTIQKLNDELEDSKAQRDIAKDSLKEVIQEKQMMEKEKAVCSYVRKIMEGPCLRSEHHFRIQVLTEKTKFLCMMIPFGHTPYDFGVRGMRGYRSRKRS